MNKLNDEVNINKQVILWVSISSIIFMLMKVYNFVSDTQGTHKYIYDFIFYTLSDYYFVSYYAVIMILLLVSYLSKKQSFYKYCLLKYKNKFEWYKNNLLILFGYCIFFTFAIIALCIIMSFGKFEFTNKSSYISSIITLREYNSFLLLCINLIFLILYLYILCLTFFISNLKFKNSFYGLITSIILVVGTLNILPHKIRNASVDKFNIVNNVVLSCHDYLRNNYAPTLLYSLVYLLSMTFGLIIFGYIYIYKFEINFGEVSL